MPPFSPFPFKIEFPLILKLRETLCNISRSQKKSGSKNEFASLEIKL